MTTPSTLPLFMKGIKQGSKVTDLLGLNTDIMNLNESDIVDPNLVMFCMDNFVQLPGNPKGLIRDQLNGTIKLTCTL